MTASTPQIRHEYRASGAPAWGAAFIQNLHVPFIAFMILSNFSTGSWFIGFWVACLVVQLVHSVCKGQLGLWAVSDKHETRNKQYWLLTFLMIAPLLAHILMQSTTTTPLVLLGTALIWAIGLINTRYNSPWVYTEERQAPHRD